MLLTWADAIDGRTSSARAAAAADGRRLIGMSFPLASRREAANIPASAVRFAGLETVTWTCRGLVVGLPVAARAVAAQPAARPTSGRWTVPTLAEVDAV